MILAPRNIQLVHVNSSDAFLYSDVVVGVGLHNQAGAIKRCLNSIFEQELPGRKLAVVLLDDQSSDSWERQVGDLLTRPEIVVLKGNCGTPSRTRNAILDFIDEHFLKAKWVARLDADDRFTCSKSLAAACDIGDALNTRYVLGGNRLVLNDQVIDKENPATQELMDGQSVLSILIDMAAGTARNELPSCNLLLAVRSGWRYPDIQSAEDHWLVADLLLNHAHEGAILESPFYCDYTLSGCETIRNLSESVHSLRRQSLLAAAVDWEWAKRSGKEIIGHGQEGVVRLVDGYVEKLFYPNAVSDAVVDNLKIILEEATPFIPSPEWHFKLGRWIARYPHQPTESADHISIEQAREFLLFCLTQGVVCKNIKRANFRVTPDGKLFMPDIGKDVVAMRVDYFRDSAARLYALAALGCADGELLRRRDDRRQEDVLNGIPGFDMFYRELVLAHAQAQWREAQCEEPIELPKADNVTLLIKCCAMDAEILEHQVRYIVSLLSKPRTFREVLLIADPYLGPFLRQHCIGDFELLKKKARRLKDEGIVNRFIVAPDDKDAFREINSRWFSLGCPASHTTKGAPVTSQLWGFDQVGSRFVLQCDVDILIGRRDLEHDYLTEMMDACSGQDDVLGVAFNIPHPVGTRIPYDAPLGEYVPEVRCGLLDLDRIKACQPLSNRMFEGALNLTWHRSLQQYQRNNALRTFRGGDARTFYIHPENHWKSDFGKLAVIRDLTAQGELPLCQLREWDLKGDASDWSYPRRHEDIVFLLKGCNTSKENLKRCFSSLRMQDDQSFGLVVIDDASDVTDISLLQHYLSPMKSRSTLIRRHTNVGRIPNFITGIKDICLNPETLIVILDLDDALINPRTVSLLREKWGAGHDVIIGEMFRPDKPLKVYCPSFENIREKWGAEVWIHLRSFKKRLFDQLPDHALKINGEWIQECTDYATMIPIVELASSPVFIPEYLYCHERTTVRTSAVSLRQEQLIKMVLAKRPQIEQQVLI